MSTADYAASGGFDLAEYGNTHGVVGPTINPMNANSFLDSILNNAAALVGAIKGPAKPVTTKPVQTNNTGMIIGIAVGAVALILVLVMLVKK